jgi:hypothetical protein
MKIFALKIVVFIFVVHGAFAAAPAHVQERIYNQEKTKLLQRLFGRPDILKWYKQRAHIMTCVREGADLNTPNRDTISFLDFVVHQDDIEAAQCFLEHGAHLNLSASSDATLLRACSVPMAQLLIKNRADIHVTSYNGENFLHRAIKQCGFPELIAWAYKEGVSPHATNSLGNTPLHQVCLEASRSYYPRRPYNIYRASLLLLAGADLRAENKEGKNPIDLSRERFSDFGDFVVAFDKLMPKIKEREKLDSMLTDFLRSKELTRIVRGYGGCCRLSLKDLKSSAGVSFLQQVDLLSDIVVDYFGFRLPLSLKGEKYP